MHALYNICFAYNFSYSPVYCSKRVCVNLGVAPSWPKHCEEPSNIFGCDAYCSILLDRYTVSSLCIKIHSNPNKVYQGRLSDDLSIELVKQVAPEVLP